MLFQIDAMSRTPVYEQFINQVETYLLTGILREGDKLPSVRSLAVELSVNPNTVQKAMIELDRRGVITAVPGKGSYIAEGALDRVRDARRRKGLSEVRELLNELRLSGITKEELIAVVEEIYRGQENGAAGDTEKGDYHDRS
ncbi:MAG: GntR family transcriptional regulator [Lachnospiraceae bacterium]|nr:GntR family transcriptional regulator [Lachnospiraceae bacterium]